MRFVGPLLAVRLPWWLWIFWGLVVLMIWLCLVALAVAAWALWLLALGLFGAYVKLRRWRHGDDVLFPTAAVRIDESLGQAREVLLVICRLD